MDEIKYKENMIFKFRNVEREECTKEFIESAVAVDIGLKDVREIWYCKPGMSVDEGLENICSEANVSEMVSLDWTGEYYINVFIVKGDEVSHLQLRMGEFVSTVRRETVEIDGEQIPAERVGDPGLAEDTNSVDMRRGARGNMDKMKNVALEEEVDENEAFYGGGSDGSESFPRFNPERDLDGLINLKVGMLFSSADLLRKAIT